MPKFSLFLRPFSCPLPERNVFPDDNRLNILGLSPPDRVGFSPCRSSGSTHGATASCVELRVPHVGRRLKKGFLLSPGSSPPPADTPESASRVLALSSADRRGWEEWRLWKRGVLLPRPVGGMPWLLSRLRWAGSLLEWLGRGVLRLGGWGWWELWPRLRGGRLDGGRLDGLVGLEVAVPACEVRLLVLVCGGGGAGVSPAISESMPLMRTWSGEKVDSRGVK